MSLVLAGLLGIGFFWLTDPRYGAFSRVAQANVNIIDSMRHTSTGTFVGIAGSALVLLIGLWLMTRRTA
jgi:uncharacterized membrane protein